MDRKFVGLEDDKYLIFLFLEKMIIVNEVIIVLIIFIVIIFGVFCFIFFLCKVCCIFKRFVFKIMFFLKVYIDF